MEAQLMDVLRQYFRGEWLESTFCIVPIGALSLTFGVTLLAGERSAFVWGVAIPFAVLGLALLVTGAVVTFRTPGQVSALELTWARNPAALVAQELPRMAKVNAAWPRYLTMYVVFAVSGLLLRFVVRLDWAEGAGIALVFFAGVGLLIDGFAERRARPYTAALEAQSRPR